MSAANPILVPLDGSKAAEQAIPLASRLAAAFGAPLRFVHVMEGEGVRTQEQAAHAAASFETYTQDVAHHAGLASGSFSATALTGAPAEALIEAAKSARMVVIASHGRGGFQATFLGSVADKVIRGANVPVLMVPATEGLKDSAGRKVLIALDGSEGAEAGLAIGRELAEKLGSKVVLVRSYNVPPPVGVEFAYYPSDLMASLESGAKEYIKGVAKPGEEMLVTQGAAANILIQAAEDLDAGLVVMTSTGKGRAARIALGSVTDRVVHHVRRPILIVRA